MKWQSEQHRDYQTTMIGLCLAVLATWFSGFSVAASEGFGDLLAFDRIGGVLRAPKSCFEKDAREADLGYPTNVG
jgi:hypothetical protein